MEIGDESAGGVAIPGLLRADSHANSGVKARQSPSPLGYPVPALRERGEIVAGRWCLYHSVYDITLYLGANYGTIRLRIVRGQDPRRPDDCWHAVSVARGVAAGPESPGRVKTFRGDAYREDEGDGPEGGLLSLI